jgi:putative tryptophan/tyrosine transport system substrate-binding protein
MRRREFITFVGGAAVAWPLAARAQQPAMPVVGFLSSGSANTLGHFVNAFQKGLAESGYIEGQNISVEYRYADGQFDRLPTLASELARLHVTVIVAGGGMVTPLAAKNATATIPIVFSAGGDPVRAGLVSSLNRPGGNITGFALFTALLQSKRLELLNKLVPNAKVIGFLINPNSRDSDTDARDAQAAIHAVGKEMIQLNTYIEQDFDAAFAMLAQRGAGAFLHASDPIFVIRRTQIIALAAQYALPGIYTTRELPISGGLMSYGDDVTDSYRQVGIYTGRILKGEKPADLPVVQPTKFEFVINRKTAKTLGLEIPPTLLALADEVIE